MKKKWQVVKRTDGTQIRGIKDVMYFKDRTLLDEKTGCWLWQLSVTKVGYGQYRTNKPYRMSAAHRGVWEAAHGPILNGLYVLHKCDVKNCDNPDHLFLGTQQDNADDRVAKGRQCKGVDHGRCFLTEAEVLMIRSMLKSGKKQRRIAQEMNITFQHVSNIKLGKVWKHL